MAATDVELLADVAGGDQTAFARLYDRHAPRVFGLLIRILGNRTEAEDVLQEAFFQVWTQAERYDASRASPAVWLTRIARSRAIDALRRRRDVQPLTARPEPVAADDAAAGPERGELVGAARGALTELPHDQRLAICLSFYCGLTHEQIAQQQGEPLGTVKTRIRRGMMKLRDILESRQRVSA